MGEHGLVTRNECPACASRTFGTVYECEYTQSPVRDYLIDFYSPQGKVELEYLEGASYVLCECAACASLFQRDIPGPELMERLYEHWIDPEKVFRRHQEGDGLERHSSNAQEIMRIVSHLGKQPSELCVFDFGMGWAQWAMMAKAFGCDAYGTELSQKRIEHARKNGIKVITWDEIPRHRFDFINTEQVFEHIAEPLQTLRHLKTALKPGGLLKISVPHAHDIDRRLKVMDWKLPKNAANSLNPVAPLEHINCFRRSSLARMAREAGMEEVLIPITTQLRYATDWGSPKRFAENLIRPLYRNVLRRHNYAFFRSVEPPAAGGTDPCSASSRRTR